MISLLKDVFIAIGVAAVIIVIVLLANFPLAKLPTSSIALASTVTPDCEAQLSTAMTENLQLKSQVSNAITVVESFQTPETYTKVWVTVYGLTVEECDADPTTGAFGKMGRYPNEMALTRLVKEHFNAKAGDEFLVLIPGNHSRSGIWTYHDVKPVGKGKNAFSIDLQIENSNFSGWGFIRRYTPTEKLILGGSN